MIFNLSFGTNTILSRFFVFVLIIDLNSLLPAVIKQIFDPTAEMTIPMGMPTNKAKAETKTQAVTVI